MNYPSYFKNLGSNSLKPQQSKKQQLKSQQNKPHTINLKKAIQQDPQSYVIKNNDSFEVKDLKSKMKTVMQKLSVMRKQKQHLHTENLTLQKQIITLRNNVRHMIPGFNNTSSYFPMSNEIVNKLQEFYKYECLDRFFEDLCPEELSMKGVIYFYHFAFTQVIKMLDKYFEGTFQLIKGTGCLDTLEGPVMNVLRKSFQGTYDKILRKIIEQNNIEYLTEKLITKLSLASEDPQPLKQILTQFMQKLLQLCLFCKISDPPLSIQIQSVGKRIKYNSIFNDPLDGFIKNKEQCWVVLPQIRKSENQQIVVKSLVLKTDYFEEQQEEDNQVDDNQQEK